MRRQLSALRPSADLLQPIIQVHTSQSAWLGTFNFASQSSGAKVVESLTSPTYVPPLHPIAAWIKQLLGQKLPVPHPPSIALEPVNEGCWPISGPAGHLGIQLSSMVRITNVTIGHTPPDIIADIRSAPRSVSIWGLFNVTGSALDTRDRDSKLASMSPSLQAHLLPLLAIVPVHLGRFTYDVHSLHHVQTFDIVQVEHALRFRHIVIEVENNWGFESSTCLCEVRVHGEI